MQRLHKNQKSIFFCDSKQLEEIYYGDRYNEKQEDIEREIQYEMIDKRFIDLPEVTYGDEIQIEAVNFETKEFEIYVYAVDEKGNIISDYDVELSANIPIEEGRVEFLFERDDYLDGYMEYAVEGKLVHYLLIRCEIDKGSYVFGTLVLGLSD